MRKRWIRRRLAVLVFTFFIVVFVDFQLRTESFPKLNGSHHPSAGAPRSSVQQLLSAAQDAHRAVHDGSASALRSGAKSVSEAAHGSLPDLQLQDIYIAVKTTGRFHETRLALLLETWISRTKAHVSVCCAGAFHKSFHVNHPAETFT